MTESYDSNTKPPPQNSGESAAKAKQAAFRLLSYRARSEAELRRRLGERFPSEAVEQTLTELRSEGLVDDVAFATEWRRQREAHRPRGEAIIQSELRRLGVAPEVVQEALSGFDAADNAYRAGRRQAIKIGAADQDKFKRRLWAFLQRRGFGGEVIRGAVERLWSELAETQYSDVDPDPHED